MTATTDKLEACTPPRGVFQGCNLMTPNYMGCFRRQMRGRTVYIEISEGSGMTGGRIFGATFRYSDGSRLNNESETDPSTCFDTYREAILHAARAE